MGGTLRSGRDSAINGQLSAKNSPGTVGLRAGLLKLGVKTSRKRMHRTAVGVVGRVSDVLVVEGDVHS